MFFSQKIEDANQEVRQLVERRDLSKDTSDDKLTMFRKQVLINIKTKLYDLKFLLN